MNATQPLHNLAQSLWLDNITRDLLDRGTLQRHITDLSVTGLTSNPTIFDHGIKHSSAAELLRPIHEKTNGVDGWVSLEVSPELLPHRVFEGNRPSSTILADRLTPQSLGKLLRSTSTASSPRASSGRSTPSFGGVGLGKVLAQRIIPELEGQGEPTLGHDSSTNALIRRYRRRRKVPR